jgi:O-antigen/teichoic acid export membrane protein
VLPDEEPAAAGTTAAEPAAAPQTQSHLFGRGLLYVIVWSLQLVLGTVVSPVLANVLGPSEYGSLASAIALHQVIFVLALLGIDQALVLQHAEDGHNRSARGLVSVGVVISLIMTLAIGISGPLWSAALGFGYFSPLVVVVILWTAPAAVVQVILALLVAEDRIRTFTLISALSALGSQVVGIGLVLLVNRDATTYAWGAVISQTVALVIGLAIVKPTLRGLVDWKIAWRAIRLGVPLALGGLSYFVLNAGDRIVIQRLLGRSEVGRYQFAYIIGSLVILLVTFTSSAWVPRFAAVRDEYERWSLSASARDALYRLLVPVVIAITLVTPAALRILAPASFRPDSLLIVVLLVLVSAFPVAASGATGRLLMTMRRSKSIAIIAGVAAVANIGLNLVLIPVVGIAGSAAATLITYCVLAELQLRSLPAEPAWRKPPTRLVLAIAGSILVASASTLLPQSEPWIIGRVVVAAACLPWFIVELKKARNG